MTLPPVPIPSSTDVPLQCGDATPLEVITHSPLALAAARYRAVQEGGLGNAYPGVALETAIELYRSDLNSLLADAVLRHATDVS